jgi:hypothetical protein
LKGTHGDRDELLLLKLINNEERVTQLLATEIEMRTEKVWSPENSILKLRFLAKKKEVPSRRRGKGCRVLIYIAQDHLPYVQIREESGTAAIEGGAIPGWAAYVTCLAGFLQIALAHKVQGT